MPAHLKPVLYALLGALVGALVTTTTALAGSGVGGVFNLGQANTVNAESSLSGTTAGGAQLRVENAATTQNAFGVLGRISAGSPGTLSAGIRGVNSGTNGNGFGVWGFHQNNGIGVLGESGGPVGLGVVGRHTSTNGTEAGVSGETASTATDAVGVLGNVTAGAAGAGSAGVQGRITAVDGYGVFGQNFATGPSAAGVFGRSTDGTGILGRGGITGASLFSPATGVYACAAPTGVLCPSSLPSLGLSIGGFFQGRGETGIGAFGCAGTPCLINTIPAVPVGGQFGAAGAGGVGVDGHASGSGAIGGKFRGESLGVLAQSSAGGQAGRFEGDVHLTGKLTREYTAGTAKQATPLAYAAITSGGSVIGGASTPNVTSTFDAVNKRYAITIAGETYDLNKYVTVATPINSSAPRFISTQSGSGKLLVKIFDLGGTAVQNPFTFITYKP